MPRVTDLVRKITKILDDHKGLEIVTIDLRKIENSFTSFFVICTGTSNVHVGSLADAVEDEIIGYYREKPFHVEGRDVAQWVILDYTDVLVHIFQNEQRNFYKLEDFWGDGIRKEIKNVD
ncbi:MAG: ribosome silencing factor [Culturomica sp.]|jgi:ribosome-associated protein|nr:ribosome silencing factor [Culturomica sp.]